MTDLDIVPLAAQGETGLLLRSGTTDFLVSPLPVRLITDDGAVTARAYDSAETHGNETVGLLDATLADGTRVTLEDRWSPSEEGDSVLIRRSFSIAGGGAATGVRAELVVESALRAAQTDWQFYVTGALYNRNDTDLDGKEDYLGSYVQEYRDDRNGHLAVLAYLPDRGQGFSLARTTVPTFDTAINDEELVAGVVVRDTDIGSLGLISEDDSALVLRAGYPFGEERTFSLETSGRGWAGFLPVDTRRDVVVEYELRVFRADDITEAIWSVTQRQMARLGTRPAELPLPLEELERHRFLLTQLYFKGWDEEDDPRRPAGYLTHFSPRNGDTLGSLIEYGFTGAQSLHALNAIRRGYREGVPLWITRARRVLDFFVRECQSENGFSEGIYDPLHKRFVRWFTGILMPFQYSDDEAELRTYLGSQMTESLRPIAQTLRTVPGNYTRTMTESIYPLLLAYEEEARHGVEHANWLAAGERFGTFLLSTQGEDGSWHRGYSPEGEALTTPVEWFGKSYVEQRSGTIFPIEALVVLHRLTGKDEYKQAALRAADFITDTFVPGILYCGGLNDTSHIKSVKVDSVGVMFAMRSLIMAHQLGGQQRHLEAAVKAAKVLSSWLFLWDVPFPEGSLLHVGGFRSTGWAVCDAIPGGGYVDDEFLEFVGDMLDVAVMANEPAFIDIVEIVLHGMQHGLSIPGNMLGYAAPGIQCEGYMTSYWLSAPEETAFSGAVNKKKGADNDTCNGLVNAQALYGLDDLRDTFGTFDFTSIREQAAARYHQATHRAGERSPMRSWESPAEGRPLRWGILGTGYIAEQFAADLPRSRTGTLAAVASRDATRAAAFGERHGASMSYGSYEELVAAPDVDCVYIALPNSLHLEWVQRAAEAGNHILCEKPLALDAEQAVAAFDAAQRHGVLLLEAFMFRMHPQIETLAALLRHGAIGEPRVLEASFGGNMRGGFDNFRMQRHAGGGSLLDLGCYGVSLARLVAGIHAGQPFADPSSVKAVGRIGEHSGVDEWTAAVLGFDTGLVATVVCGNQVDIPSAARIWGDAGSVVLESPWQPDVGGRRAALLVHRDATGTTEEIVVPGDRPLYALEVDAFAECVGTGTVPFPLMDAADTLGNMRTLDAWRQEIGFEFNQ